MILSRSLATAAGLSLAGFALAAEPPTPSNLRVAFEAQFPKSEANATALELEALASGLGIDLAPQARPDPEKPGEPVPPPQDGRARPASGTENRLPVSQFLQKELAVTEERIGRAAPVVERFLDERAGEIEKIESVLLGNEEPRWEMDVTARLSGPTPNFLGLIRLQRVLLARALVLAREKATDAAMETMEASWRLHGALLSRPEGISQLMAIAVARLQAGVLRKIDSPAYGWSERLRAGFPLAGYEASLQNETWLYESDVTPDGTPGPLGRAWRVFVADLEARGLCSWDLDELSAAWQEASEQIETESGKILGEVAAPNLFTGLLRARRVAIDSELTALVLDARAERSALRHPRWPAKLITLGAGICPEWKWTYRVERNGTARFALEGRVVDDGSPFLLPMEFTAGTPLKRRPAKKGVVINPPPSTVR